MSAISYEIDTLVNELSQAKNIIRMQKDVQIQMAKDKSSMVDKIAVLSEKVALFKNAKTVEEKELQDSVLQLRTVIASIKAIVDSPVSNPNRTSQ